MQDNNLHNELKMVQLFQDVSICWNRYKLGQYKDQVDEIEMSRSLTSDNKLSAEEYEILTRIAGIIKTRLFNLLGTYLHDTGTVLQYQIENVSDKEEFLKFIEEFKRVFSGFDVTDTEMKEVYDNCVNTAIKHVELRLS